MVESVIAGRYRLQRRIGSGGMSEVWAATDLELDRTVAVKLLAADADPARFGREARAAASLAHVNVCAVFDYGLAEGRRFMVLEYLPGGSLEDRLPTGKPLPDDDSRRIAGEIAAGLAHAHERGVVHRDLKPANILFDAGGRAKIADFGIARAAGATGLTEAGTVLGTAAYISPEQAAGRPATPASDVYAFGVILFRMLTARLPFESQDALALAAMHRDLPPPLVSDFRSDAPPLLESVASASLAKSPADRPQDGSALVAELAGAVSETSGGRLDSRHRGPRARRGRPPQATAARARRRHRRRGRGRAGNRAHGGQRHGSGAADDHPTGHDSAVDRELDRLDRPERAGEHRDDDRNEGVDRARHQHDQHLDQEHDDDDDGDDATLDDGTGDNPARDDDPAAVVGDHDHRHDHRARNLHRYDNGTGDDRHDRSDHHDAHAPPGVGSRP